MALKRIGNWSDLRLDGFLAWIHRFVMLITFPLRHFWKIIIGLLVIAFLLLIVPLYCGAQFGHIGEWYKKIIPTRISITENETISKVADKIDALTEKVNKINNELSEITPEPEDFSAEEEDTNEDRKLAIWNVKNLQQAKYKPKAKGPQNTTIATKNTFKNLKNMATRKKTTEDTNNVDKKTKSAKSRYPQAFPVEPKIMPQPHTPRENIVYGNNFTEYYEYLENRGLIYVDNPRIIYGSADITGPNSLYVNNTFLFLYGIYTDEQIYDSVAAKRYLHNLTENTVVYCAIVAYTAHTNTATALCFANGVFINKSMVNHNLATNVGLK